MTRRKVPSLFAGEEPTTYVVDSSAWFNIDHSDDPTSTWTIITMAISQDRIALPSEVIEEIKLDDGLWHRLQQYEKQIRSNRSDEAFLLLAGQIASENPAMCGLRSKKTRADPFVIALAHLEGRTVV